MGIELRITEKLKSEGDDGSEKTLIVDVDETGVRVEHLGDKLAITFKDLGLVNEQAERYQTLAAKIGYDQDKGKDDVETDP